MDVYLPFRMWIDIYRYLQIFIDRVDNISRRKRAEVDTAAVRSQSAALRRRPACLPAAFRPPAHTRERTPTRDADAALTSSAVRKFTTQPQGAFRPCDSTDGLVIGMWEM